MFGRLDPAQWGGADVALSVSLRDGRVVWLFGDTLSTTGFVHSSAVVQTGGCLHVSQGGAQLLPNASPLVIYWIHSARAAGTSLQIAARAIEIFGSGPWDFRDAGYERVARARVDAAGNVTFDRWSISRRTPAPDPGPMIRIDPTNPHHFGYGRLIHPEARLSGGRTLVTTCQNWDDGRVHPPSAYRPLFSEQ